MLEKEHRLPLDGLACERAFECQRVHRIEVVAHDPRIGHVDRGWVHIRCEHGRTATRFDRHHLMNCDSPAVGVPVCSASYNPATDDYNSATIGRIVRYRAVLPAGQSDYRNATQIDMSSRRCDGP